VQLDSYADTGLIVAVELVNALAITHASGRPVETADPLAAVSEILAVDPASLDRLRPRDVPDLAALAEQMRAVFADLAGDGLDAAAGRLNDLLAAHPAHPHLAKEGGRWRLHHHPTDVALVPMWTSICAEAVARFLGDGHAERLGTCAADDCDRVFVDLSKNASRRFCSTTCQNRVKAAAFRHRSRAAGGS
jgi:predicted RNA-binding Zn ribbon-like protein